VEGEPPHPFEPLWIASSFSLIECHCISSLRLDRCLAPDWQQPDPPI